MQKIQTILILATLAIGSTGANADLSGLVGQDTLRFYGEDGRTRTDLGNAAYAVIDLYLDFSAENTEGFQNEHTSVKALRGMNFNASGFQTFVHQDITGPVGSWAPQDSQDVSPDAISAVDSFVTLGGMVGSDASGNSTSFPIRSWADLSAPNIFNPDLRWANYDTMQTQLDSDLKVWIGRFVVDGESARSGASFSVDGRIFYTYGSGTSSFSTHFNSQFAFTPAPGAVAFFGLGGALLRRRRA